MILEEVVMIRRLKEEVGLHAIMDTVAGAGGGRGGVVFVSATPG